MDTDHNAITGGSVIKTLQSVSIFHQILLFKNIFPGNIFRPLSLSVMMENPPVKGLSGGERQRLFIVLALIPQPDLVFLDELTTGLDAKARRGVWKTLKSLKEQGLTIFLTSHFMDEVEALCDEICILKKGTPVFLSLIHI